jgi:uncharacterized membrane protein YgcG
MISCNHVIIVSAMTSVHMLLSMDLTEPSAAAGVSGGAAGDADGSGSGGNGGGGGGRRAVIAHRDLLVMLQKEVIPFVRLFGE